jgi:hypothetical protein
VTLGVAETSAQVSGNLREQLILSAQAQWETWCHISTAVVQGGSGGRVDIRSSYIVVVFYLLIFQHSFASGDDK